MKRRIILFGAGSAAQEYISSPPSDVMIQKCVDNDGDKWSKDLLGVPIASPRTIWDESFDEIHITTQWVSDVRKQLTQELHVPSEKIVVPDRRRLTKPCFANPEVEEAVFTTTADLMDAAMSQSLPLVADMGTLLGLVRESRLIPWDNDVDLSIPPEYMEDVISLLHDSIAQDHLGASPSPLDVTCRDDMIVQIVMALVWDDGERQTIPLTVNARMPHGTESLWLPSPSLWAAPRHHFDVVENIEIRSRQIQVPSKPDDYLKYMYGPDWRTPKPDFTYGDYPNN